VYKNLDNFQLVSYAIDVFATTNLKPFKAYKVSARPIHEADADLPIPKFIKMGECNGYTLSILPVYMKVFFVY
jgi:hypothetical protein